MTKTEDIEKGNEAAGLLDHPLMKEAFESIEKDIFNAWRNSAPDEGKEREDAYLLEWALDRFKQRLTTYIANGKMAQRQLTEES